MARFPNLQVTVTAPEPAPELSAAVEVAAYRIATEAITNVARHSDAQLVNVDIQVNGSLELAVHDDGSSREVWRPGVGLRSMHDRASELGGHVTAGAGPDGGHVLALLPLDRV